MTASVIFRFSNRSHRRAENLKIVLRHALKRSNLECIVVAMEKDINLADIKGVRKKFVPEPFESAKANNIGASMAKTNIFIFQDADIVFRLAYYDMIIEAIKQGNESVRVGENCVNLGMNHIRRIGIDPGHVQKVVNTDFKSCLRDAPGACIALTREAFVRIGGHCELFKVYGWEDCYMRTKVKKLTKQKNLKKLTMHLPHETNYQMGRQAQNGPLYQELLTNFDACVKRDKEFLMANYKF